jgi:hypothetical protein
MSRRADQACRAHQAEAASTKEPAAGFPDYRAAIELRISAALEDLRDDEFITLAPDSSEFATSVRDCARAVLDRAIYNQ